MPSAIRSAVFFLFLGAMLGVWLRLFLSYGVELYVPYSNTLHAHSHVLFFGWISIFLGIHYVGNRRVFQRYLVPLLVIGTAFACIAFLAWGYTAPSIAASALFYIPWMYIARFTCNEAGELLKGSAYALSLAVISTLLLPVSVALHASDLVRTILVQIFLHFLIDGWIVLSLIHAVSRISARFTLVGVYLMCLLVAPLTMLSPSYALLGSCAHAIAASILLTWLIRAKDSFSGMLLQFAFWVTVGRCLFDIAMPLGFLEVNRALIVAHIHSRTLGFSTVVAIAILAREKLLGISNVCVFGFVSGTFLMLAGLVMQGLAPILDVPGIYVEFMKASMLLGSLILAICSFLLLVRAIQEKR